MAFITLLILSGLQRVLMDISLFLNEHKKQLKYFAYDKPQIYPLYVYVTSYLCLNISTTPMWGSEKNNVLQDTYINLRDAV